MRGPAAAKSGKPPASGMRSLRGVKPFIEVTVVYGGTIGLLLLGEVLLAREASSEEFGTYSLVKQAVPMVAVLGLLGYDQALTRESAARYRAVPLGRHGWLTAGRAALVGAVLAAYMVSSFDLATWAAVALVAASAAVVITSVVSGVLRATSRPLLAAVTQQGYRLGTAIVLVATLGHLSGEAAVVALALSAIVTASLSVYMSTRFADPWLPQPQEHRHLRRLGYGYALGMLGLAASDWVDQAFVAHFANTAVAGNYAQAKLLTVYPLLSVGSILGFLALPYIAKRRQSLTSSQFSRWLAWGAAICALSWAILTPTALVANDLLFHASDNRRVMAVLAGVGAIRLLYVLPSAALGAVGSPRDLAAAGALSAVAVLAQCATSIAMLSVGVIEAATIGLAVNIVLRLSSSTLLCIVALRRLHNIKGDEIGEARP